MARAWGRAGLRKTFETAQELMWNVEAAVPASIAAIPDLWYGSPQFESQPARTPSCTAIGPFSE